MRYALAVLTVLIAACGGNGGSSPTAASSSTPAASATSATSPTPSTFTNADGQTLLGKLVIQDGPYWYECDVSTGLTLSSCPLTQKLMQRIPALTAAVAPGGVGGGPILLRQQFFASAPQVLSISPTASGYTMRIQANIGTVAVPQNIQYDLSVVNSNGTWLVDDISCANKPQTSAYQPPTDPKWACS